MQVKKVKQTKKEEQPRFVLPRQKSATDTSNWERRAFTASTAKSGKRVKRNLIMWRTDINL